MANISFSSLDGPTGASQSLVAARSYYNVVKPHLPSAAPAHLPEVVSMGAGRNSSNAAHHTTSATFLSRPPSAQTTRALPELVEDVYAPVPLRASLAGRVLPVLPPSHRGSFRAEGNSSNNAVQTPSPDSVFRPISLSLSTYGPLDQKAISTATTPSMSAASCPVAVVGEETVRPLLCPPMRPMRATPVLGAAARTNPFCPEGVQVRRLPSCSPRVLSAPRTYGRHAAPRTPSAASTAAALWEDAATDAEVLAFFGPASAAPEWGDADHERRASKDMSWPAATTPQSSVCELSASEDMFSIGTASSEGSSGCGAHRSAVIDADALALFQRDGARRQREVGGRASSHRVAH